MSSSSSSSTNTYSTASAPDWDPEWRTTALPPPPYEEPSSSVSSSSSTITTAKDKTKEVSQQEIEKLNEELKRLRLENMNLKKDKPVQHLKISGSDNNNKDYVNSKEFEKMIQEQCQREMSQRNDFSLTSAMDKMSQLTERSLNSNYGSADTGKNYYRQPNMNRNDDQSCCETTTQLLSQAASCCSTVNSCCSTACSVARYACCCLCFCCPACPCLAINLLRGVAAIRSL